MLTLFVLQLKTGVNIVKNEGFLALYSGLGPAIGRGLFYGGEHFDNSYPHADSIEHLCCCTYSQHYDAKACKHTTTRGRLWDILNMLLLVTPTQTWFHSLGYSGHQTQARHEDKA